MEVFIDCIVRWQIVYENNDCCISIAQLVPSFARNFREDESFKGTFASRVCWTDPLKTEAR